MSRQLSPLAPGARDARRRVWASAAGLARPVWRWGEGRKSRPGHPGPVSGYLGDRRQFLAGLLYPGQLLTRFQLLSPSSSLIRWTLPIFLCRLGVWRKKRKVFEKGCFIEVVTGLVPAVVGYLCSWKEVKQDFLLGFFCCCLLLVVPVCQVFTIIWKVTLSWDVSAHIALILGATLMFCKGAILWLFLS